MSEEIKTEPLPEEPEVIEEEPPFTEADLEGLSEANHVVPELLASIVFKSPPASKLPPSMPVTKDALLAEQYVSQTSPLLEILGFHTCLGGVGRLPTGVRLIGSLIVLVGGVFLVKLQDRDSGERKEETKGT
jgi:hypothetical protein